MASRRMFHIGTTSNSDIFHSLTAAQRSLYYDFMGAADDDGFVSNARQVLSYARARQKDIDALVEVGYLIKFDSGIYCVTHWLVHNNIRADQYRPTLFQREYSLLEVTRGKPYIKHSEPFSETDNNDRIGKDSLGESRPEQLSGESRPEQIEDRRAFLYSQLDEIDKKRREEKS